MSDAHTTAAAQPTLVQAPRGFKEFMPGEQIVLNRMLRIIQDGYQRFGFVPIETGIAEYKGNLFRGGKGLDKEAYSLTRHAAEAPLMAALQDASTPIERIRELVESMQTEMAVRYDMTMPMARYVAQHEGQLVFPFRRWQMQKAVRGERPQADRFREFYQCDIDVIGRGSLSLLFDAEIPSIIYQIFTEMNIGRFVIRMSNATLLEEYLLYAHVPREDLITVKKILDDVEKHGMNQTIEQLGRIIDSVDAQQIVFFLSKKRDSVDATLEELMRLSISDRFAKSVQDLAEVVKGVRMFGIPDNAFAIDLTVVRGLEYYTGTLYETNLVDHPGVGSICSGGRYDNLLGDFTKKGQYPGVGISIGLTRLLNKLLAAGIVKAERSGTADVLVVVHDQSHLEKYLEMATELRRGGIATEVYLEKAKPEKQIQYARKKGCLLAVLSNPEQLLQETVRILHLDTNNRTDVARASLVDNVKYHLELEP